MDVGRTRGVLELLLRGAGLAEPDVLLDRAVEQEGVLVDDRDQRADLREGERAQVVAAERDAAAIRIVEAQQEPHDRRLAATRRPDQPQPLAGFGAEREAVVHGAACPGIGEAHVLEGNRGRQRLVERGGRRVGDARLVVEDAVDALGGGEAHHALVQHGAEFAHRPEDLDAQHQDDEQSGERHGARLDARGAVDQRGGRTAGDGRVGDAARQRVGAQHPHGAAEKVMRLDFQLVGARLALAEGFQGGEALDRIEELGCEGGIGLLPALRVLDVELVPQRRREQGDQREGQHHCGHRQVDERDHGEDQQRRQHRDQELRQELAEIGFELFDAVDHGKRERARALAADRARSQGGDAVVERAAQDLLDAGGGFVRHHGAPVLGPAAQHHDAGDRQDRPVQARHVAAGEHEADQPAQQTEAGNAEAGCQQADGDGAGDAPAHALRKHQETRFDMHERPSFELFRLPR